MRSRLELAAAILAVVLLGVGAGLLGTRSRPAESEDPRRSTFVTSPQGARALADALIRLRVTVTHLRHRLDTTGVLPAERPRTLLAYLAPSDPLTRLEAEELARRVRSGHDLLLAGDGAALAISCYGLYPRTLGDSVRAGSMTVRAVLTAIPDSATADSAHIDRVRGCVVPVAAADTLLRTSAGPAAIRFGTVGGASVILVADGRLFSNRMLRETGAGEFALGLIAGTYPSAVFDEYHHGFGPSGSLAGAVLAWSVRSPWGWAAWQLLLAAVAALAAGAVRFGPARRVIERRRRSPLEHVRALANALAASRGHDIAVALQVRGLRRRLARSGLVPRGSDSAWLADLAGNVRTPRARAAAAALQELTRGPQPAGAVLRAADAVEDVWEELKP